ncbi:Hypothetical protein, putative [Bodo saltans]|uniref:EF-hand domain-containing protein n=1 Tax=Bodo saltans TaxID=75058 RepID=A0A0S4IS44_BODSA|nr:Hypothetical protein, putative [Bodo saltans]|eukprot:CUF59935.1 Hypothetical protein, putative [Bodo saltans]
MTTALTEGKWILEYLDRSSRQLYFDACLALDIPVNERVYHKLCNDAGDFTAYTIQVPECEFVGERGVQAFLPVLKVNQLLTLISFPGQGVSDDVVTQLVPLLKQHERLHVLDVRRNPEITDASADILAQLIKLNTAITQVRLEGTSLSPMVQRTLNKFATHNRNSSTIFLTGDYVAFKMLFELLDIDRSGAVSLLDIINRTSNHEVFDAVERRFGVMDLTGDSKLQIDEFLNFLHPNFFPMKERMLAFLKLPDDSEENIVANWKMLREAARRALVACPSFHLARVNHKKLTIDEAILLVREAVVHEHRRSGSTPECVSLAPSDPSVSKGEMFTELMLELTEAEGGEMNKRTKAILDMYTTIQARSMYYAVDSLFGGAELTYWKVCQQQWSTVYNIRITPSLARHCHVEFTALANADIERSRTRYRDVHALEVPLEELLKRPIQSSVWTLDGVGLRRSVQVDGMDISLNITFAEWFTLLNDRFDIAFGTQSEELGLALSSPARSVRQ